MKERPILFSTPMVHSILLGMKTQTRRIVKGFAKDWLENDGFTTEFVADPSNNLCPYGRIGDILWVRETFAEGLYNPYIYMANIESPVFKPPAGKWKPSIHMPKKAARIWLKITDIRIERLRDISEDDAIQEGVLEYDDNTFKNYFTEKGLGTCDGVECLTAISSFQTLICSIHTTAIWDLNPWVWVVSFEVLSTTSRPDNLQQVRKSA